MSDFRFQTSDFIGSSRGAWEGARGAWIFPFGKSCQISDYGRDLRGVRDLRDMKDSDDAGGRTSMRPYSRLRGEVDLNAVADVADYAAITEDADGGVDRRFGAVAPGAVNQSDNVVEGVAVGAIKGEYLFG